MLPGRPKTGRSGPHQPKPARARVPAQAKPAQTGPSLGTEPAFPPGPTSPSTAGPSAHGTTPKPPLVGHREVARQLHRPLRVEHREMGQRIQARDLDEVSQHPPRRRAQFGGIPRLGDVVVEVGVVDGANGVGKVGLFGHRFGGVGDEVGPDLGELAGVAGDRR